MKRTVGILIFNEVEVLDFAGPFEVFGIAEIEKEKIYECFTVAENEQVIHARNGLLVKPNYTIFNCPKIDILIVPGGYGAEKIEIKNIALLNWINKQSKNVEIIASVCTGAFLLAKSRVIQNDRVTTHWMDLDVLQKDYPDLKVEKGYKYIDNGKIMTSSGISAGIELALHIVEKENGKEIAVTTAKRMEYNWTEMVK